MNSNHRLAGALAACVRTLACVSYTTLSQAGWWGSHWDFDWNSMLSFEFPFLAQLELQRLGGAAESLCGVGTKSGQQKLVKTGKGRGDLNPNFKQDSLFSPTCTLQSQTGWVMLHQLTKPGLNGLKCPFYFINLIIIITNITSNVFLPYYQTIYSILYSCMEFMFNTTKEYLSICCYSKSCC